MTWPAASTDEQWMSVCVLYILRQISPSRSMSLPIRSMPSPSALLQRRARIVVQGSHGSTERLHSADQPSSWHPLQAVSVAVNARASTRLPSLAATSVQDFLAVPGKPSLPMAQPAGPNTADEQWTAIDSYDHDFDVDFQSLIHLVEEVMLTPMEMDYWYALQAAECIFRLDKYLYVLQDWDTQGSMIHIGKYYHTVHLPRGMNQYGLACMCLC
ncbi:hypothetical protein BDW22DRAFT_16984 [Trametopsis cervina]|nr:hypothetical protein BDW22DRAFT_16984 [Trametopsis cervina]